VSKFIIALVVMLALGASSAALAKSDRASSGGHALKRQSGSNVKAGSAGGVLESEVIRNGRIIIVDPDGQIVEPLRRTPSPADY